MTNTSNDAGKILIFSGVRGDTRRYRTLHLYEQLRLAGADCVLSHLTDPRLPRLVSTAQVAILHRVADDSYVEGLFRELRKRNALTVMDADDFLYDPAIMQWIDSPDFQDPVRANLYRQEIRRHRLALERCDAISVSTAYLAEMMSPFDKPLHIQRNAFSLEMLALSNQAVQDRDSSGDRVVLGYASGTRTHDGDFAMIKPVLRDLLDRCPQVELWLMGAVEAGQDWGMAGERVRTFPLVPWRALPGRLAQLDVNLAPLIPESPFNQAKSEIKFMEAALVRVPTVASRTSAFEFAIKHGQTGFLAASLEEWQASLEYLIENSVARKSVGEAAYQDVLSRYAPWDRGLDMLQALSDFATAFGRRPLVVPEGKSPVDAKLLAQRFFTPADEAHPTMAALAGYSVRHRGVQTLLGQVWVYFRRKLEPIFPFQGSNRNE